MTEPSATQPQRVKCPDCGNEIEAAPCCEHGTDLIGFCHTCGELQVIDPSELRETP